MQVNQSTFQLLYSLWGYIAARRQIQFWLLLILMLLTSFAEILSIGAVLPFLGVLTAPERVFEYDSVQPVIAMLELTTPEQLILPFTLAFGLAALVAGAMRLLLLWASTRLSFAAGADLGINIYRRTLYQPYAVHCTRNSSEIISGISRKSETVITSVILPFLTLISSIVMLVAILITLLTVEPYVAIAAFGGFGLIYTVIIQLTRKKLHKDSLCTARESVQLLKALQEGLGGIRDVLIDGSQSEYCRIYRKADLPLRKAQGNIIFVSASPRYAMEALGIILISVLAYTLAQQPDGLGKAIPVLGALALGAQRLLPVLQQTYGAWTSIVSSQASLQDTLELLAQPLPKYLDGPFIKPLFFNKHLTLSNLSFRYNSEGAYVLNKINLRIPKGARVGFIGVTGSGKSTLLDIIMGLLQATDGQLEVDGQLVDFNNNRSWQDHIAHVPQAIFLTDSSIEENIAFGVPKSEIDIERVKLAAEQAQISETIESFPKKYQTFVGERGIRLSGGQRQRIGIARALYKQANIIVFDEATSALDSETEEAVMQAIDNLRDDLTLLIIAHRFTTLKSCTQVVELDGGKIKRKGSYQEVITAYEKKDEPS